MVKSPERWQRPVEENSDGVFQSHCRGRALGDGEEKCAPHCILGYKAKEPFSTALGGIRGPSGGLCCHLVASFGNDTLV